MFWRREGRDSGHATGADWGSGVVLCTGSGAEDDQQKEAVVTLQKSLHMQSNENRLHILDLDTNKQEQIVSVLVRC